VNTGIIRDGIASILEHLGFDLEDPNFVDTPRRVALVWMNEFCQPTLKGLGEIITVFPEKHDQMIIISNHTCWTRCPHHLERVKLKVSIGYLQGEEHLVVGASKLPRIADYFAKTLTMQETLTDTIANAIDHYLKPKGVGVHIVGQHHCMCARGVESDGVMLTTALRGNFLLDGVKTEFLEACRYKHSF